MPIVSGSTVIRGSRGTPVAQDADDKLITVIQGSQGTPIAQDATDRLIAMMYGSAGNPVAQDANDKLITVVQGDQDIDVAQTATGELITDVHGSQGVAVKQKATGELITEIIGSTGNAVAQDANDKLISVIQGSRDTAVLQDAANRLITAIVGSTGNPVSQDVSDNLVAMMYGSAGNPIAQDASDNLIAAIKGNYLGALVTVAVDSLGLMQSDISKSEKILIIETDKDSHFTGAITQFSHETENLTGLSDNKIFIRGVNIQSDQPLKFRLIFWTSDSFSDVDLDLDSYIDDVVLDMSDEQSTFRISSAGQYYLNISNLNILYEDEDSSNEIHCSLQNLSATSKIAGATGEVQIDIKYAPRL